VVCTAQRGATIVLDEQGTFVADPMNPYAAIEFTISWQERNIGDTPSGES